MSNVEKRHIIWDGSRDFDVPRIAIHKSLSAASGSSLSCPTRANINTASLNIADDAWCGSRQTQLWELSKFEPIGTHQEEIEKEFCSSRLNTATQNAIGFALSLLLDPSPGDAVTTINLKKVFTTCHEKFCSMNGAQVGRL
jgi:hypothetical protein